MASENIHLIEKISENPEAFGEIIDIYEEKLMRYILRITNVSYEEAEGILQDVFIRAYTHIYEYDERYTLSSWMYRIAHNLVIDYFRKNKKEAGNISLQDEEYKVLVDSLADHSSPHVDMQSKDVQICVQKAISALVENYREVIILRCIEGYSYEEISDILKIPIGTASTLVNRAKKQLKENLLKLHCNS